MPEEKLLERLVQQLSGTVDATTVTNIDRMKVAICGEPKTGKSNLIARTARKPLLHYDFDDRKESIAGQEGVIIKTLVDIEDDKPTAWGAFESDLATLLYAKKQNELPFKSIAVDSITFLRKYAEHQFLKDAGNSSLFRTYKISTTKYLLPQGYDTITGVQKMLESALTRLFSLEIDVYATFHTRNEKDNLKSTKDSTVYKDNLTIEPPNLKMLLPKFNDQWRTFVDSGKYMVQLHPDFQFNASTVLKNVNDVEEADIQKLLEKHNNGRK